MLRSSSSSGVMYRTSLRSRVSEDFLWKDYNRGFPEVFDLLKDLRGWGVKGLCSIESFKTFSMSLIFLGRLLHFKAHCSHAFGTI